MLYTSIHDRGVMAVILYWNGSEQVPLTYVTDEVPARRTITTEDYWTNTDD